MALLEAAAARLPAVVTNVGDIGKLIVHEQTGLIIPGEDAKALADALLRLRDDRGLAARLAEGAHRSMLESFSSEAMCQRYLDIYRQILSTAGKTSDA